MKKNNFTEGQQFSKEKVLNLIETFGLNIEHDTWHESGNDGYIRVKHKSCNVRAVIHQGDLEFYKNKEKKYIEETFQKLLIKVGETKIKNKFKDLLS